MPIRTDEEALYFLFIMKAHRHAVPGGKLVMSVDVKAPEIGSDCAQILNISEMPDSTYTFTWVTWESPIRGPSTDSYTVPAAVTQLLKEKGHA